MAENEDEGIPSDLQRFRVAFEMVGQFLFHWGGLERVLQKALATAFELDPVQDGVLVANTQLRDKINILKTFANLSNHPNAAEATKVLNRIADQVPKRNQMAHDFFWPDFKEPAVRFMTIKAKGKFDLPAVLWTVEDFSKSYDTLDELAEALKGHLAVFRPKRSAAARRAMERHKGPLEPREDDVDPRSRPPRLRRGSRKAKARKRPQKPQG